MRLLTASSSIVALASTARATCSGGNSTTAPLVHLANYGTFRGTTLNETQSGVALPGGPVTAWLGMDYAAQPVGPEGRFFPIDDRPPAPFDGIRDADAYGPSCVQDPTSTDPETQSEACLSFNVYRTPGVPLAEKLPVLVWIHGGAFYAGSWASFDGASFASAVPQGHPVVVVSFHYRINSLGFLPSALFAEEGLLNLGLRDQRTFLEFVQANIASFGGDPNRVTIGGRSAGAHSVGIHDFHAYGIDEGKKPLFAAAIHQSGSVTARGFPGADDPLYEEQMATYMDGLGCPHDKNTTNEAAMQCLRAAPIDAIRNVSTALYNEYDRNVTWPFQPVHGGPLFEKPGSQSGLDGTFFRVPVISSTTTDEGKYYVPGGLETDAEFLEYMSNGSPALTTSDLSELSALYPDPAIYEDSPYAEGPSNGLNGTQYERLAAAWSDYAYICPGQETAYRTSSATTGGGVPTWKLRFDVSDNKPDWQGVPHTSDTKYTWAEPTAERPEVGVRYHRYLAGFVVSAGENPNLFADEEYSMAEWPSYEPEGYGLDSKPAMQLVMGIEAAEVEEDAIRREQCLFWRDPERAERLSK